LCSDCPFFQRLSFRLHGGELWLLVDAGTVVGVGTTSPYYASLGGFGVGADASSFKARSAAWVDCARAFHRRQRGVDVYVSPRGGKSGTTVQSIAMIRAGYAYAGCAPGS
jgi:hypothetical protein